MSAAACGMPQALAWNMGTTDEHAIVVTHPERVAMSVAEECRLIERCE